MPRFKVLIGYELDASDPNGATVKALREGKKFMTFSSVKLVEGSFKDSATRQIFGKGGRK